ncbi:MAG: DUF5684 domain-containing protein [Bacillota bacterium]|nr:DUF5684 domain-containing protein [Bacillota bacterium]
MLTILSSRILTIPNKDDIQGIDVGQQTIRVIILFTLLACLIYLLFSLITYWRIFRKAGEPGWAVLIPIYNAYVLFKITWGKGWYFLLMLIPLVNLVIAIVTLLKLAQAFGYGGGFVVGLILLYPIFMLILAFGRSYYYGVPGRDFDPGRRGQA